MAHVIGISDSDTLELPLLADEADGSILHTWTGLFEQSSAWTSRTDVFYFVVHLLERAVCPGTESCTKFTPKSANGLVPDAAWFHFISDPMRSSTHIRDKAVKYQSACNIPRLRNQTRVSQPTSYGEDFLRERGRVSPLNL